MSGLNYCVWCGYKLDHSEKFCPKCGANLKDIMDSPDIPVKSLTKYEFEINNIKSQYDEKEEEALKLIQKRFNPTEITYTRFVEELNRSHNLFYKKIDNAKDIIDIIDESSPKIEEELKETVEILNTMLQQLKDLITELIINSKDDKKSDMEIDALIDDMNNLINSIKNYQ